MTKALASSKTAAPFKILFTSAFKPEAGEGSSLAHSSQEPQIDGACSSLYQGEERVEDHGKDGTDSAEEMEDAGHDLDGGMGGEGSDQEGGIGGGGSDHDRDEENHGVRTIVVVT